MLVEKIYRCGLALFISVIVLLSPLFTSCTTESGSTIVPELPSEREVKIVLELPYSSPAVGKSPSTYSIGDLEENTVEDIDLLVFEKGTAADGSDETFLYRSKGVEIVSNNSSGNEKTIKVKVANSNEPIRLVFLANVRTKLDALTLTPGATKSTILQQLTFITAGKWNATSASNFSMFPMWGESSDLMTITSSTTTFPKVKMIRALARVDILVNAPGPNGAPTGLIPTFEITSIEIHKTNNKGSVVPLSGSVTGNVATSPNIPTGTTNNSVLNYDSEITVGGLSVIKSIYIAESLAGTDASDCPFLIIGAKFAGGTTTYYRFDFIAKPATGQTSDVRLPILRNHRYVFNIKKVEFGGYPTKAQAITAGAMNGDDGLEVEHLAYSENTGAIAFDNNYFLATTTHDLRLSYSAQTADVVVYTDHPDGWSASIDAVKFPWATILSGATNATPKTYSIIRLQLAATTVDKIADLEIKFGRMTQVIKISQIDEFIGKGEGIIPIPINQDYDIGSAEYGGVDNRFMLTYNTLTYNIPWGVPLLEYISNWNSDPNNNALYDIEFIVTMRFMDGGTPSVSRPFPSSSFKVRDGDVAWFKSVTSSGGQPTATSFSVRATMRHAMDASFYQDPTSERTGIITLKVGNVSRELKVVQKPSHYIVKKGRKHIDNNGVETQLDHSFMVSDFYIGYYSNANNNWYDINNVPNEWNSLDDVLTNQNVPATKGSCARLNEINYMGFTNWRVTTLSELKVAGLYGRSSGTYELYPGSCLYYYNGSVSVMNKTATSINPNEWGQGTNIGYRCVRTAPEADTP